MPDVSEYVYSLFVSGSVGNLFRSHNCLNGSFQNVHWFHAIHQEYVTDVGFEGSG